MPRPDAERPAGNLMSTKQIAYAAYHGRKVTFRFLRGGETVEVTGYVTGADDYKVMLAVPGEHDVDVVLVHKTAEIIRLHSEATLADEPPHLRIKIENIGRSFWLRCARLYFGEADDDPSPPRDATTGRQQRGRIITPVRSEGVSA